MPIEFKFDPKVVMLAREMCEASTGSAYHFDKCLSVKQDWCYKAIVALHNLEAQGWVLKKV
jgi:hypothetical protein